ncbi:hypothetical protein GCM10020295_52280 [Streptomyces cinereospinus]
MSPRAQQVAYVLALLAVMAALTVGIFASPKARHGRPLGWRQWVFQGLLILASVSVMAAYVQMTT